MFKKINDSFIKIDSFNCMTIIGDPGCDGFGAGIMSIFARALNCKDSEFNIVIGDLVPYGSKRFYRNVFDFVDRITKNDVYVLCGNHDTDYYHDFFGLSNYVLSNDEAMFIVLDNSKRKFSEDTLSFLSSSLESCSAENVIILFHIPPPNNFTQNSVKQENWEPFRKIILPHKDKVKYLMAGHVHSFFEDEVDGIPLIVTGGGGARIEDVCDKVKKENIHHHAVKLYFNKDRSLKHEYVNLEMSSYDSELNDSILNHNLKNAFNNEILAHFKYKLFSNKAAEEKHLGLSKLFKALSDSEFIHAKNHYSVLNGIGDFDRFMTKSIDNENYEITKMYKEYLEYADQNSNALAKYTFSDALEAEKVHKPLLVEALNSFRDNLDYAPKGEFFICSSCGYTFCREDLPEKCPVCGAPKDKIDKS